MNQFLNQYPKADRMNVLEMYYRMSLLFSKNFLDIFVFKE